MSRTYGGRYANEIECKLIETLRNIGLMFQYGYVVYDGKKARPLVTIDYRKRKDKLDFDHELDELIDKCERDGYVSSR